MMRALQLGRAPHPGRMQAGWAVRLYPGDVATNRFRAKDDMTGFAI